MHSQRRKKRNDSPSPEVTIDFITPDYKNPNLYHHRRTSSSDSVDSGIGSTGSSHHSSITTPSSTRKSKKKKKPNPFSTSQVRKEVKRYFKLIDIILYNIILLYKDIILYFLYNEMPHLLLAHLS